MTKLQRAIGAIILLSGATIGIAALAQSATIESLETTLERAKQSYQTALETCRAVEMSLATAKLEMQGAAKLPVDQIERLQKKAKGENLEVCPLN